MKRNPLKHQCKIAVLGSYPPLRGVSSYCLEMIRAITPHVAVDFISFAEMYPRFAYPGGDLADDLSFPIFTCKTLRVRRKLTWYNPLTWISEGLATKADLLHAQWWSMPLAPIYACICLAFKLRHKPVVFTVHNVIGHEGTASFRTVSRLLFKLADHFIVHTQANRQTLISHYGIDPAKVHVIPHGSLDFQVCCTADRQAIRREMGFIPNHKVILLFGAIRPYKGLTAAIQALARVVPALPEARLLVAGKLWEPWAPYQRLIDKLGLSNHVATCLDYIPAESVHRYFCAADLTVLPYQHFDSQSGVGSTAVAFRLPMIVSDVGGLPELVRDRRWIVPPGDADALASAIIECLANPADLEAMARESDKVACDLDWCAIAQKTCALYEKLIRSKASLP